MCGRYQLIAPPEAVRQLFAVDIDGEPFPPRYNIAPTQPIHVVHRDEAGRRRLTLMRWGLLPSWVKDPAAFTLLINARIETAPDKPAFRAAMKRRRCLVPATGFYEWRAMPAGPRQPFLVRAPDAPLLAFAGIFETWIGPDGEEMDTAAILTREASEPIRDIHDRMPVVVPPEAFSAWLDTAGHDVADALGALGASPDGFFAPVAITSRINSARNEGPEVAIPAEAAPSRRPDPTADGPAASGGAEPAAVAPSRGASRPAPRKRAGGGQLDLL